MKHGKKYRAAFEKLDEKKVYGLEEAFTFLKENATAKFVESVEVHVRLGINPKKNDEQVRSTVVLPHGVGRSKKVAVITSTKAAEAEKAGADLVGGEQMIEDIKSGKIIAGVAFDILVATPEMMPKLAGAAKILGPKGLMPNPKNETVTSKIAETVEALKKGSKVSFRNDDSGNVHQVIGKLSFTPTQLVENLKEVIDTLHRVKPDAVKGKFVRSIAVCSTMSPSLHVEM